MRLGGSAARAAVVAGGLALAASSSQAEAPRAPAGRIAASAEAVEPLEVGARIPSVHVLTVEGTRISLDDVTGEHPVALIFYRGGW